jgi:cell division protein FtsW (lipid II flippase)
MASRRNHIDIATLIIVLALMVVSVGVVYSASAELAYKRFDNMDHYLDLHAIKILLSIAALFVGSRFRTRSTSASRSRHCFSRF